MFKFLDKVANAGTGSRMSAQKHAAHRGVAQSENHLTELAAVAANLGATRVARKAAREQLVNAVGEREAKKREAQAARKVRDSF